MSRLGKDENKANKSGGRRERLAAALRENLRRRKAQERRRGLPPEPGTAPKGPVPRDDRVR
jgi:hypothetical protein